MESAPWLRQKGESNKSYALFQIHLNLPHILSGKQKTYKHIVEFVDNPKILESWEVEGNLKRTLLEFHANINKPTTEKTIQNLASKWKWSDRVLAYENHLETKRLEAKEKEFEKIDNHNHNIGRLIAEGVEEALREMKYQGYAPTTKMNILDSASASMNRVVKDERVRFNKPTDIRASDLKLQGEITEDINLVQNLSLKEKDDDLIDEILAAQENLE